MSALHFYERQQPITSRRTAGNQRRYKRDTLRRVALAELPNNRVPTRQDWARLSRAWQESIEHRIHLLRQLHDKFTDCVGCGRLSIDRCALANPDDKLGAAGPGPRRLL